MTAHGELAAIIDRHILVLGRTSAVEVVLAFGDGESERARDEDRAVRQRLRHDLVLVGRYRQNVPLSPQRPTPESLLWLFFSEIASVRD